MQSVIHDFLYDLIKVDYGFWLQIQIPLKKVATQTIFLFHKFSWEYGQKCKKLEKSKVSLTYPF